MKGVLNEWLTITQASKSSLATTSPQTSSSTIRRASSHTSTTPRLQRSQSGCNSLAALLNRPLAPSPAHIWPCAPRYYSEVFPASGGKDTAILDICSSWISHYPKVRLFASLGSGRFTGRPIFFSALRGTCTTLRVVLASPRPPAAPRAATLSKTQRAGSPPRFVPNCRVFLTPRSAPRASACVALPQGYTAGKISGLGMNEAELKKNSVLTDYVVADLNKDPKLPYPVGTHPRHPPTHALTHSRTSIGEFRSLWRRGLRPPYSAEVCRVAVATSARNCPPRTTRLTLSPTP